jgi:type I restriction enzyme R subunit
MPVEGGGRKPEPELDRLSNLLKAFNEQFGTLFNVADRIFARIKDEIAPLVADDQAFRNAGKTLREQPGSSTTRRWQG